MSAPNQEKLSAAIAKDRRLRPPDHEYHSYQDMPLSLPEHQHTCLDCHASEICTDDLCEPQAGGRYQDALCVACLDRREMAAYYGPLRSVFAPLAEC